ncbi:oligosaccharyl transferase subunit ost3/OST6 [Dimargaris verticillata]|uniref:Oligosaccharyl transferase subunit ost3/OST6 n=1 Tax=Dimargaris verticillata TaxID=2761393 RepID=A0A9W8AYR3_9FUNG|nr:oligosaccharyl transferase subunit ost3/OST6 [Dimargaris verticillata]
MRCLIRILALCWALVALAASESLLADLKKRRDASPVLAIDTAQFDQIVANPTRSYAVLVLFTSLGKRYQCEPCSRYKSEFELVARSWLKTAPANVRDQLFFLSGDVDDMHPIFNRFGIQSIPLPYYFPPGANATPNGWATQPQSLDLNRVGLAAEDTVAYMQSHLHLPLQLARPFNWRKIGLVALASVVGLLALALVIPRLSLTAVGKNFWSSACIVFVLMMCCGFMFVRIRGAPYSVNGPGNQPIYVLRQLQSQLGIEIQILASLYAVCGACCVALTSRVPRIADPLKRNAAVVVVTLVLILTYSFTISIYAMKNPAYPFRLLL